MGEFDREHRKQMVQLALAFRWGSQRRLHENVGSLLRGGLPADPAERERVFALADQSLEKEGDLFEVYASLIEKLTRSGFVLDPTFSLFIKSQFTLAGIYRALDPDLNPDDYAEKLTRHRVMAELPKRLLLLPAWTYRGYRSLMSNGEVFSEPFR
jgi:predicted unusual protein kinase regulating ubiquinone biosynthesis (AarF/ABC1/UbiB family)